MRSGFSPALTTPGFPNDPVDGSPPTIMKLKLLIGAVVVLVGLFVLNRYVGKKKEYIAGVPAAATPASGVERQHFTVGFLPVT